MRDWVFRKLIFACRFTVFIFINAFFSPFFLSPFCRIAKRLNKPIFGFVFLLYPGHLSHLRSYIPLFYRKFFPYPAIIGFLTKGEKGERGLVMAFPWTIEEMEQNIPLLEEGIKRVSVMALEIGVKSIALGGRIVPVLHKRGFVFPELFAMGDKGAVFGIWLTIKKALGGVDPRRVGIFGHGFLGSHLAAFLERKKDCEVIAVDPRFTTPQNQGKIRSTPDPKEISSCDLVVVLTPRGEQVTDEVGYLKDGVYVVDDTHPPLTDTARLIIERKNGKVFQTFVKLPGSKFFPKLPTWGYDWIPGCCIEAIVKTKNPGVAINTQEEFNQLAEKVGFQNS